MSEHRATVHWEKRTESFAYADYERDHEWRFDEGRTVVTASAAPAFLGKAEFVDPEEAFVASLSSCHMLTFLAICSRRGIAVERYTDRAVGYLERNEEGQLVIARVELRPRVSFASGHAPDPPVLSELHAQSHRDCFLANSVRTRIAVL